MPIRIILVLIKKLRINLANTRCIIVASYLLIVEDADGDHVRCRWAESSRSECGGVCRAFPASLDESAVRMSLFCIIIL